MIFDYFYDEKKVTHEYNIEAEKLTSKQGWGFVKTSDYTRIEKEKELQHRMFKKECERLNDKYNSEKAKILHAIDQQFESDLVIETNDD
jgi:hypothetical protein